MCVIFCFVKCSLNYARGELKVPAVITDDSGLLGYCALLQLAGLIYSDVWKVRTASVFSAFES